MNKKVFQCKSGHCVCPECFYRLKNSDSNMKCPTCRIKLDKEPIRCLLIEKLYPSMVLECENKMHGCDFCGTHNERKEHLKECKFKKVSCGKRGCCFTGTPKEYFIHWCTVHARPFECQMENAIICGKLSCVVGEQIFENKNKAKFMEHDIVLLKNDSLVMYTMTFCFDKECQSKNTLELKPRLLTNNTNKYEIFVSCKLSIWKNDESFVERTMHATGLDHVDQKAFESNSSCDDTISINDTKKIKFEFSIKDGTSIVPNMLSLKRQRSASDLISKRVKRVK